MALVFPLLICTILGMLSVDELYQSVTDPVGDIDGKVYYINPNGPLNLLYGYLYKEKRQMHNKRLFSPGLKVNYFLMKEGDSSKFTRNDLK
ncbi:hypothetical protein PAEPH01_2315, partial [Pancytospora epiphaga]